MSEPKDPFTTIAEEAIRVHELFMSFVDAGFTRVEALMIVTSLLTTNRGGSA